MLLARLSAPRSRLFPSARSPSLPQLYDDPTEVIDLRVFSSVKSSEDYTNRTHSFDVYSSDTAFSMVAASESEKEDWIRAIGRAIVISRTKSWQEDNDEEEEGQK